MIILKNIKIKFKIFIINFIFFANLFFKQIYQRIINFKNLLILMFVVFLPFPISQTFSETGPPESETEVENFDEKKQEWEIEDYINTIGLVILGILILMLLYPGDYGELGDHDDLIYQYFHPKKVDPYDLSKEWVYPKDGIPRPPQRIYTRALEDYFVIPEKPYFVDGVRNWPLLNKDIMDYAKIPFTNPDNHSIPPYMVKYLEICYGYDLTQDQVWNLEFHRNHTQSHIPMEWLYDYVIWYYKKNPVRQNFSLGLDEYWLAYYEGKDFYDTRIYPGIYTRWRTRPKNNDGM